MVSVNAPIIVVPDDSPPVLGNSPALPRLRQLGEIRYFDSLPNGESDLISRIHDAAIVVNIRSSCKFTRRVFESIPRLRLLSLWGTGTDNVDLAAAREHNITVANTPGVAAPSVAEHALALLLAVAHRIPRQDAAVRQGSWPRGDAMVLAGKVLGVVGLGAIGARLAELGRGIGMRVVAWTFHPKAAPGIEIVSLEDLLRTSDVVSLHVRLSPKTERMIGQREFEQMKPGAILINTARGAIVDEAALAQALSSGRLAGAGLDVFCAEPLPAGHDLAGLPNVVLTPHSAGITPEALEGGLQLAVENVRNFLASSPSNVVIAPESRATA
jgi:phosphoglycerate dehydrogenase-like enzyme